jgi:UDP-glucose 4-epimerase
MNIFQNKTICITGGSGFLATNLANEIIIQNPKKLILVDNFVQSKKDNIKHLLGDKRVELHYIDIGDNKNFKLIKDLVIQSDYVYNLAAADVNSSEKYPNVAVSSNVNGTLNILKAIKYKPETRMVYTSSGSVVNLSTVYAITKLAGEQLCLHYAKNYGVKVSIVRPHHVFGEYQNIEGTSGVINKFLFKILRTNSPVVWGNGSAVKAFTYVKDVVNAIILLSEKEETIGKVYDVASDTRITIKDLAELLIKKYAVNKDMKIVYDKPKLGENSELHPNTEEIKKLGWEIKYTFEEGLDKAKEWIKEQINK